MRYRLTSNDKLRRMLRDYPLATKQDVDTIALTPGPPGPQGDAGLPGAPGDTVYPVQTSVFVSSTPYSVQSTDVILYVNAFASAVVVLLPVATGSMLTLTVKKVDSSANAVTVTATTANIIDGASTQVIDTQYTSLTIQDAAANTWYIL